MARRTHTLTHSLSATKILLSVVLIAGNAINVCAADSTNVALPLTHGEFVDSCRTDLATRLIGAFTPYRTRPIVIVPDLADDSSRVIANNLYRILSDRGLLVRDSSPDHYEAGNWTLRYELSPIELVLSEPQRRAFLGNIWVKRTLNAGVSISVYDDLDGLVVWSNRADSTYHDWILKSDLKKLENEGLAPQAPLTGWEKAQLPLLIGGGALIVGAVMLALN